MLIAFLLISSGWSGTLDLLDEKDGAVVLTKYELLRTYERPSDWQDIVDGVTLDRYESEINLRLLWAKTSDKRSLTISWLGHLHKDVTCWAASTHYRRPVVMRTLAHKYRNVGYDVDLDESLPTNPTMRISW